MHQIVKTYDVRIDLSEIQYRHLQHRLNCLTTIFQNVQNELKKRTVFIQQQRTYRRGTEEERLMMFHRRYVHMEGSTR